MVTDSAGTESRPPVGLLRRMAAFCADYLVGACYAALLFSLVLLFNGGRVPQGEYQPWQGQAVGLFSLTIPVVFYFAVCESSRWQASIGKRLLGLRVQQLSGERLTFRRSLRRSLLKFLPWELAHCFVHQVAAADANRVPLWAWALIVVAVLLDTWYLVSILGGQAVYDRLSGAQVVAADR